LFLNVLWNILPRALRPRQTENNCQKNKGAKASDHLSLLLKLQFEVGDLDDCLERAIRSRALPSQPCNQLYRVVFEQRMPMIGEARPTVNDFSAAEIDPHWSVC
jgi:hypothetical protein